MKKPDCDKVSKPGPTSDLTKISRLMGSFHNTGILVLFICVYNRNCWKEMFNSISE